MFALSLFLEKERQPSRWYLADVVSCSAKLPVMEAIPKRPANIKVRMFHPTAGKLMSIIDVSQS